MGKRKGKLAPQCPALSGLPLGWVLAWALPVAGTKDKVLPTEMLGNKDDEVWSLSLAFRW